MSSQNDSRLVWDERSPRADGTPSGALTSRFISIRRGQHCAPNNTLSPAPSDGPQPALKLDYPMGEADHPGVDAALDEPSQVDRLERVTDDRTMGDRDVAALERG